MNEPFEPPLIRLGAADLGIKDPCGDVQGRRVVSFEGEYIGTIDDLFVNKLQRTIRFLEVGSRGAAADGPQTFLIPVQVVARVDDEEVSLSCSRDVIATAPTYNPHVELISLYLQEIEEHFRGQSSGSRQVGDHQTHP